MNILPKCEVCGCSISLFLIDLVCEPCSQEMRRLIEERERQEAQRKKIDELKIEQERLAKVEEVSSKLRHQLALLIAGRLNCFVMVNFDSPGKLDSALLVDVKDSHFTVKSGALLMHFPFQQILHVYELNDTMYIRVNQLIIYEGGTSYGVSVSV